MAKIKSLIVDDEINNCNNLKSILNRYCPEVEVLGFAHSAEEGLEQVGIYHSHPAPPEPSESDLEFMKYNPCVWVIDGRKRLRFRMKAFQLWQGFLLSVDIDIVPE